ncbi:PREDICTED: peptidyl-tRNA hydrolase 2, mitochondrial-like [Priapulus caudatus]|uniref:peptidyl-tRNA hydrolase n=1 Tax=Priapulus caudatus TaxID=37621 RepID=A0ABM1E8A5_PRICU|nr:PREDICTED: peptidyl-tRNA hydrolase 2, mitochondrial-like [Priapulus caudatus]
MSSSIDMNYLGVLAGLGCGLCIGWLLKGRLKADTVRRLSESRGSGFAQMDEFGEYKLVIAVRSDLKMGKGKIAAQCSHASVLAYKQTQRKNPELLKTWDYTGQPKVVVKVEDEEQMYDLAKHAKSLGLITSMIADAGRTQIAAGSKTVIGIGPGPKDIVDKVTGHLKLM